jgi:hypothetical protein
MKKLLFKAKNSDYQCERLQKRKDVRWGGGGKKGILSQLDYYHSGRR